LVRIYCEAHPAGEIKSVEALAAMIARPEYLFLTGVEADAVIGFAIAIALAGTDATLLEYMAVNVAHRGRGVGQKIFRAVAQMPGRFLVVEVDSDRFPSPDAQDRVRRKQFYRRLGCKEIEGLIWRMPRVSTAEPPLMDMLVQRGELPDLIEKPHLRAWIEACYAQVYQQALPDDRIEAMLADLPDEIRLI
jgi:GNAT superfamily N-acetyltransferase